MRRNNKKGKLPRKRQFTPVLHRKRHTRRSFIRSFCVCLDGGDKGIRTPDLCVANASLYQLSHIPIGVFVLQRTRIVYHFVFIFARDFPSVFQKNSFNFIIRPQPVYF